MRPTLEVCVDTPDCLNAAIEAGVDRIELCSALALGGLTPSAGLLELARKSSVPIYAMIRPRAGGFVYSETELTQMEVEIEAVRAAGLAGVVFGATTSDGGLDQLALARLSKAASGLGKTLHRAVDELANPRDAVPIVIDFGFERILTSGGAATALEGLQEISAMMALASEKIEIMAGSGVSAENIPDLRRAGVWSFHGSFSRLNTQGHKALHLPTLKQVQQVLAAQPAKMGR